MTSKTVYSSDKFRVIKHGERADARYEVRPTDGSRSNFLPTWMQIRVENALMDDKMEAFCRSVFD